MPFTKISLVALFAFLLLVGCDNTFDPKAEFQEELIVYAVLSKNQPKQVVRLESTYDAELTDPTNPTHRRVITEATVYISDGKKEYKFVQEENENSETAPYIWTSTEMIPTEGRNYNMRIIMDGNTVAKSEMQMPVSTYMTMAIATTTSASSGVRLAAGPVNETQKGYYFRLYVLALANDGTEIARQEVPYEFNPDADDDGEYVLPAPGRETSVLFPLSYVQMVKSQLAAETQATNFRVMGIGYAMEANFYNYYKVVRGFDDPVSVRQDNPNITNITGGLGVFGGVTADTLYKGYAGFIQ